MSLDEKDLDLLAKHSIEIEWVKHHDALLHTRIGFWMAGQSIAGAVVASQALDPLRVILVSAFGLVLTALWFQTCRTLADKIRNYSREVLPQGFRDAWHGGGEPKGWRRIFLAGNLLTWALPAVFGVAWMVMLAAGAYDGWERCGVLADSHCQTTTPATE